MNRRQFFLIVLVALIGLGVGGIAGYRVSQDKAQELDSQRLDLMRAIRAADLQNRVSTLRFLRELKASEQDVRSLETSAILLLDTVDLDTLSQSSESRVVLMNVAKSLRDYLRDFPSSEFDPSKHKRVAQLLSLDKS